MPLKMYGFCSAGNMGYWGSERYGLWPKFPAYYLRHSREYGLSGVWVKRESTVAKQIAKQIAPFHTTE